MRSADVFGPVLAVIPTFNERANIGPLLTRLHEVVPSMHVLIVDDASPDGTGILATEFAANDARVHVLHRREKAGLGAAYVAGFRWGLAREYAALVEMDADGSHEPADLPRILHGLSRHDLVLGSRYVTGGRVVNWPRRRQLLSRGGNLYSKIALGVGINDITSGFRAYRREVLGSLNLDRVASHGYCFQIDLAWRTVEAEFSVTEVPITFVERERGHSKMNGAIVREALVNVGAWGIRRRRKQLGRLLGLR